MLCTFKEDFYIIPKWSFGDDIKGMVIPEIIILCLIQPIINSEWGLEATEIQVSQGYGDLAKIPVIRSVADPVGGGGCFL